MKVKAIGFINNGICIKDENDNLLELDTDIYLPIILQKIDEWLNNNISLRNISTIIFDSIKEIFNVNKIFKPNSCSSIVPKNNELYNYLLDYIKNHPIYKEKQLKSANRNERISNGKKEYKNKNDQYLSYIRERCNRYDDIDRHRGFSFYK